MDGVGSARIRPLHVRMTRHLMGPARDRSLARLCSMQWSLDGGGMDDGSEPILGTGEGYPLVSIGRAGHFGRLGHREPWRWCAVVATW